MGRTQVGGRRWGAFCIWGKGNLLKGANAGKGTLVGGLIKGKVLRGGMARVTGGGGILGRGGRAQLNEPNSRNRRTSTGGAGVWGTGRKLNLIAKAPGRFTG